MTAKTRKAEVEVIEEMHYVLTMPDGSTIEGKVRLRDFKPNMDKGFQNSGFSAQINDGRYAGNINIRDNDKKKLL